MRELILMNPKGRRRKTRKRYSVRNSKGRFTKRKKTTRRRKTVAPIMSKRKRRAGRPYRGRTRTFRSKAGRIVIRRNPMGGDIMDAFKAILSKDNLQIAGGAIASNFISGMVTKTLGDKLPMYSNPIGKTVYTLAIPVVTALFVRKFAPKFAEGIALGGLITAVNQIVAKYMPTYAGTFNSYIDGGVGQADYPMGRIGAATSSIDSGSGMTTALSGGYSGTYDSPMPYSSDAWSN